MVLDHAACHAAVRAKDARFDGMFFTAVKTTGVYCRPVCPAKTPLPRNCEFYETPAAAEAAGFRPCLRCRPELSPAGRGAAERPGLAEQFIADVQNDGLFEDSLEGAAARLGVTSRHLRRVVEQECGVSPLDIVRTTRLLFARRLLSTTTLPVSSVAFGSGFGSLARFNHAFREQYGVTPTGFRNRTSRARVRTSVRLTLATREPFAWDTMLNYIGKRSIPGIETVREGCYWRTLNLSGRRGWLRVSRAAQGLEVEVSDDLAAHLLPIAGRVRAMFDADASPEPIRAALSADPLLRPLVSRTPGLRVPGSCDGFELAVRAILGQQVTVRGASTIAGRLVQRLAEPAPDLPSGLTHWPISPEALASAPVDDIAKCGIPGARASTLRGLAGAVARGRIDFQHGSASRAALHELEQMPGIGPWTREYIAMRVLRWPDAFPSGDLGLRKAVNPSCPASSAELEQLSERWRPWRAYAAMYLWNSAQEGSERR